MNRRIVTDTADPTSAANLLAYRVSVVLACFTRCFLNLCLATLSGTFTCSTSLTRDTELHLESILYVDDAGLAIILALDLADPTVYGLDTTNGRTWCDLFDGVLHHVWIFLVEGCLIEFLRFSCFLLPSVLTAFDDT